MKMLNLDARDVEDILAVVKKFIEGEEYVLNCCGYKPTTEKFRRHESRLAVVKSIYAALEVKLQIE